MSIPTAGLALPWDTVLYYIHELEALLRRTRNWLYFPISAKPGVSMRKGVYLRVISREWGLLPFLGG